VKPSNVLIEDLEGVAVRLLDFGLAQFDGADTLTAVGDVPGTLAYIAPERLAGAEATPESDVWAVGVLLWESLAGRHPFWGVPLQEVARAIESGAPPLASERRDLPRRLVSAVDGALALDPGSRPRASAFAADLRAAFRPAPARDARGRRAATIPMRLPKPLAVAAHILPVALAAVTALLGATLLPFWPGALVAAIVLGAGLAAWLDPRIGLAVALAAPVFPLGNVSQGAAAAYGAFALAWLLLCWRDARSGLLFAAGPLLAPLGLLALVPLVVQPARGIVRRAALAFLAVLSAALVAGVSGKELPLTGERALSLGISPVDTAREIAFALARALLLEPMLLTGALAAALAAAILPSARRHWPYGVLAVGAALVVGSVAADASLAAVPVAALVWAIAGALAAGARRPAI
jgi:Protein kinase domain